MDIISYQCETAEQFWDELEELASGNFHSSSRLEKTLVNYLALAATYMHLYLRNDTELARFVSGLLSSPIFQKHRAYARRQLIKFWRQSCLHRETEKQILIGAVLLMDSRLHESTLEMMQEENCLQTVVDVLVPPDQTVSLHSDHNSNANGGHIAHAADSQPPPPPISRGRRIARKSSAGSSNGAKTGLETPIQHLLVTGSRQERSPLKSSRSPANSRRSRSTNLSSSNPISNDGTKSLNSALKSALAPYELDGEGGRRTYSADPHMSRRSSSSSTNSIIFIHSRLHLIVLQLLYQMCKVQKLLKADLDHIHQPFIDFLFQQVENNETVDDPYCAASIRVLLALNEQYMLKDSVSSHSTNLVIHALVRGRDHYRAFGENLVFLFNRGADNTLQLMMLKLLYLVFTNPALYEYIYLNDLNVLLSVFMRELLDMNRDEEKLRHTYLRVLHPMLENTELARDEYRKADLVKLLECISQDKYDETTPGTTHRLAERCLNVTWLGYEITPIPSRKQTPSPTPSPSPSPSHSLVVKHGKRPPPPPPRPKDRKNCIGQSINNDSVTALANAQQRSTPPPPPPSRATLHILE